ncbi:MAG: hypothetical protein RR449_06990 [Christensenella sp.]
MPALTPEYLQQLFNENFARSDTGYDKQISEYEQSRAAEQAALDQQKAAQVKALEDNQLKAKQDAYYTKRMAEKNLPQQLAAQGITGGMTETTLSNLYNNMLGAQNTANSAFQSANTEVGNNYATNAASLKTKWAQAISEAQQNKRNDSWAKAQWAYQAKLAEEERLRQEEERQRQEEERLRQEVASAARSYGGGGGTPKTDTEPSTAVSGYYYNGTYYNTQAEALAAQNHELNKYSEYNKRAAQSKKDKASGKDPYAWQNRSF